MSKRILIAPAGWEDRFRDGTSIDLDEFRPDQILIPYSVKYKDRTALFREQVRAKAEGLDVDYLEREMEYQDSVSLYKDMLNLYHTHIETSAEVRLNASTCPRNLIWYTLHFLSEKTIKTEFSYFRPVNYGTYVSRDAGSPQFVIKRSGIAYPDKPTCILALSGYDKERLAQLRGRVQSFL